MDEFPPETSTMYNTRHKSLRMTIRNTTQSITTEAPHLTCGMSRNFNDKYCDFKRHVIPKHQYLCLNKLWKQTASNSTRLSGHKIRLTFVLKYKKQTLFDPYSHETWLQHRRIQNTSGNSTSCCSLKLTRLFSLVRLCDGRPAVSGTGIGVAVVTHPAALLAVTPGPGTPAGETVPPPVTIVTTQCVHVSSQHTLFTHCNTHRRAVQYLRCNTPCPSRSQEATARQHREMWRSNTADTRDVPTNSPPRAPLPPQLWTDCVQYNTIKTQQRTGWNTQLMSSASTKMCPSFCFIDGYFIEFTYKFYMHPWIWSYKTNSTMKTSPLQITNNMRDLWFSQR
jgi:hypothetical protein